jgi:hypothetical protein
LAQKRREKEQQNLKRSVEAFTKMAEEYRKTTAYRKATAKSVVDEGDMTNTQDKLDKLEVDLMNTLELHTTRRHARMGRASQVDERFKNSKKNNSAAVNDNGKEEKFALQSPSSSSSSSSAEVHSVYPLPNFH